MKNEFPDGPVHIRPNFAADRANRIWRSFRDNLREKASENQKTLEKTEKPFRRAGNTFDAGRNGRAYQLNHLKQPPEARKQAKTAVAPPKRGKGFLRVRPDPDRYSKPDESV